MHHTAGGTAGGRPPAAEVASALDEYGHVARQTCRCGSTFVVTDERVVGAGDGGGHHHVLVARCLNSDCTQQIEFHFAVTPRLVAGGLGRALIEAFHPVDPARTFPCVGVGVQAAISVVAAWLAARATGLRGETLDGVATSAAAHLGLPREAGESVAGRLRTLAGEFDHIAQALEPPAPPEPAAPAPAARGSAG